MSIFPGRFLNEFGKKIITKSDDELEIGSDDYISWHLMNRARDAANISLENSGYRSLRVSCAYLDWYKPRAFIFWTPETPKDYVIACTNSTSEVIRRTLTDSEFHSLLSAESIVLSKLHPDDLTSLAVSLTLATVLYHEVAHIVRFHRPHLVELERDDPDSLVTVKGMCEADADKWASYMIAPDLLAQAKGIKNALQLPISVEAVLREVLILYGAALHLWFAFFNQSDYFSKSSIYPHPLIRSTRITIGAVDNLPDDGAINSNSLDLVHHILNGLGLAENSSLRSASSKQHSFDLADEMNAINEKYLEIDRVLNPSLKEVSSRWGAPNEA